MARVFLFVFLILLNSFSSYAVNTKLFPDLSQSDEGTVTAHMKKGAVEIAFGWALYQAAPYTPRLGPPSASLLAPEGIMGMGRFSIVNGARDFIGGSREYYTRKWNSMTHLNRGATDCLTAAALIIAGTYIPNIFSGPLTDLGANAAAPVVISYLTYRGLNELKTGLQEIGQNCDVNSFFEKLSQNSNMIGKLKGWFSSTTSASDQKKK